MIRNCYTLETLSGLENLTSVLGSLELSANSQLQDISALSSLKLVGQDITIVQNPNLEECCPLVSLLTTLPLGNINNTNASVFYDIEQNKSSCNSISEILASCNLEDSDNDLIKAASDNCPYHYNPNQEDNDDDGIGNACDNCPLMANADQADSNNNFIGDVCETAEPGKAGVNTTTPKSGLEISASELYLSDTQRGLIMTNAHGECFRLYIDPEGNLQTKAIDCPN